MSDHITAEDPPQLEANNKIAANNEAANMEAFDNGDSFSDEASFIDMNDLPQLTPVGSSEGISALAQADDNVPEAVGMPTLEPAQNNKAASGADTSTNLDDLTLIEMTSTVNEMRDSINDLNKVVSGAGTSANSEEDKGEVLRLLREKVESQQKDIEGLRSLVETQKGDMKALQRKVKTQVGDVKHLQCNVKIQAANSKTLNEQQRVLMKGVENTKGRVNMRDLMIININFLLFVVIIFLSVKALKENLAGENLGGENLAGDWMSMSNEVREKLPSVLLGVSGIAFNVALYFCFSTSRSVAQFLAKIA
jgi:hypothetical protein